jgi:hypothetical protein
MRWQRWARMLQGCCAGCYGHRTPNPEPENRRTERRCTDNVVSYSGCSGFK